MITRAVLIVATVSLLLLPIGVIPFAGETAEAPEYEMTVYQLALLVRGPNRDPIGERGIQRLQEEHLAYVRRLHEEGKALLWGPIDGGGDVKGVIVLNAGSTDDAKAILAKDSWIRSGRRVAEVHPWWTAKDLIRRPENLLYSETCVLGLIFRPDGAPDYPDEKLKEIQAGHLANIQDMADSGDLALAGPMGDDGKLRGIFVFRTTDTERIRELVSRDPARKMGRLRFEMYPWHVPRGALPSPQEVAHE